MLVLLFFKVLIIYILFYFDLAVLSVSVNIITAPSIFFLDTGAFCS